MMNEGTDHFDELVSRYLDGELSEQERAVLLQSLATLEHAARFLEITRLNAEIAGLLAAPVPDSVMVELVMSDLRRDSRSIEPPLRLREPAAQTPRSITPVDFATASPAGRTRSRFGMLKWAAVFAGLLAVASVCYVTFLRSSNAMTLVRSDGEVRFISTSGETRPQANHVIGNGTLKTIGASSAATIALKDGTRIDVGGNTTLVARPPKEAVRFHLENGSLKAQVSKQPKNRRLIFATPEAEAIVVGTTLRLTASGHSTRLEVAEGEVRFRRRHDGAEVRVTTGQSAVVAPNVPFVAAPHHPDPHHQ